MRGGIIGMRNIRFEDYEGPRLPPKTQMQRLRRVIEQELTPRQRDTILAYYFQDKSIAQLAQERGVNKSTVSRCLKRAEQRVRLCLRY